MRMHWLHPGKWMTRMVNARNFYAMGVDWTKGKVSGRGNYNPKKLELTSLCCKSDKRVNALSFDAIRKDSKSLQGKISVRAAPGFTIQMYWNWLLGAVCMIKRKDAIWMPNEFIKASVKCISNSNSLIIDPNVLKLNPFNLMNKSEYVQFWHHGTWLNIREKYQI